MNPSFPENFSAGRLQLRRLQRPGPERLRQLEDLGRSALGESALDRWLIPVIADYGLLYTAELGGEIAGAAEIIRSLHEGDLYLEGFYIRPDLQNRGYGTEMLAGIIDLLSRSSFARLLATVDPGNEAALKLYRKSGFKELEFIPDRYGPGRERWLLARGLKT